MVTLLVFIIAAASEALGFSLRLHDIRRSVGDRLRQEHGEAMMHAALGHADARLTATYGPSPRLSALAAALEWWSEYVSQLSRGATTISAGGA
jgi:integrase